jgi:HKD family nuclease
VERFAAVKVDVISQLVGSDPVCDRLKPLLDSRSFKRFRMLVAFTTWPGIYLIQEALEEFVRAGGTVNAIIGLDLGGTDIESLTYLYELNRCRVRVTDLGSSQAIFHPKVFLADGDESWAAIVGSANSSLGGLFSNAEVAMEVRGVRGEANPFEALWQLYSAPLAPLTSAHVTLLTQKKLRELAPKIEERRIARKNWEKKAGPAPTGVPPIGWVNHPPHVPPPPEAGAPGAKAGKKSRAGRRAKPTAPKGKERIPRELYMQVWGETGGGTQVQFPKLAITQFFRAAPGKMTYVRLHTPTGLETHRIQMFKNSTFRIPLKFVAPYDASRTKPIVLQVRRLTGENEYRVNVRSRGDRGFADWSRLCTERTGRGSKPYGLRT